jgi:non-heme chloroperoxidase
MQGSIKGQHDFVKAFSETDFTEDLKKIDIPTLVMHGDDDRSILICSRSFSRSTEPQGRVRAFSCGRFL